MTRLKYYFPICLFFILSIIFTYPLIFKMGTWIYGPFYGTDVRGTVWAMWWQKYAFLHHLDYLRSPLLCAPFGSDFSQQPSFWINSLISRWLCIFLGPIFFLNLATISGFILSGFLTYLFAERLTNNQSASILVGFIFAFSPYHLNKIMEFSFTFFGFWVVFYLMTLFNLKREISLKNISLCGLVFALVLDFNFYYAFFTLTLTIGFLIFSFLYQWRLKLACLMNPLRRGLLRKRFSHGFYFLSALLGVFVLSLCINSPSLIKILGNIFSAHFTLVEKQAIGFSRSFDYLLTQSARPFSYLLPASTHPIFGSFTKKMFGSFIYGRGSIEQTLYLGWVPLILAFFAFKQWRHKRLHPEQYPAYVFSQENFYIGFFIFSAWLAFICSMPPVVDFGLFKFFSPSYLVYKIFPMLRAYARFGVIVMLCVSVLSGYGIKNILNRLKRKTTKFLFTMFIFLAILFEFMNFPPLRTTDITKVPEVYSWLAKQRGDFIIAEYPLTLNAPGESQENQDYLFYQTVHQKRMVNGALAGTTHFEIKKNIMKVTNPETPKILKTLGVKYVIFHVNLYAEEKNPLSTEMIGEIPQLDKLEGYKLVKNFGNDSVYAVTAEPTSLGTELINARGSHVHKN